MIWILNSTPLIYLSKVGLSRIFEDFSGTIVIPKSVFEESLMERKEEKLMLLL